MGHSSTVQILDAWSTRRPYLQILKTWRIFFCPLVLPHLSISSSALPVHFPVSPTPPLLPPLIFPLAVISLPAPLALAWLPASCWSVCWCRVSSALPLPVAWQPPASSPSGAWDTQVTSSVQKGGLSQFGRNHMALATGPSWPQLLPKQNKGKTRDGVNMTSFLNMTTATFVLFLPWCASIETKRHNCSRFERPHRLSKTNLHAKGTSISTQHH